jgi:hypothetical protein
MISLSDSLLATGATLTFHYTHPSRDVAMQIALAMRLDFTDPSPKNLLRATVFFTGYVSNGQPVNLLSSGRAEPQFRASAISEVSGELIADNCELSAVVSQFDQSGGGGAALVTVSVLKIVFARTAGGPPIYTHVVKTWPGGRVVTEQEAKATALANAALFSIDVSQANVAITAGTEQG